MNKSLTLLCLLLLYPALNVFAQSGNGLKGDYFNAKFLTGAVIRTRTDKVIDFDFGYGPPITGIDNDNFSIRWTGQILAPVSGLYTFTTYSDDGVRLWINGTKVLDNWTDHAPIYDDSSTVFLNAGAKYDIRLEYFEGVYGAQIQLFWAYPGQARIIIPQRQLFTNEPVVIPPTVAGNGTGLRGDYYNFINLTGAPVLTRTDATVDFDFGTGSPGGNTLSDYFSARWTGQIQSPIAGDVTLTTISDDGVRLYLNGQLIIDNWTYHAPTTNNSSPLSLVAGQKYDVRMEMYENTGGAVAKLHWSYAGQADQAIPRQYLYPASTVYTAPTATPLELTTENKEVARFLLQATYGPTFKDITDLRIKGIDAWLNEQFSLSIQSHQQYLYDLRDAGVKVRNEEARESFWKQALTGRDQLRQRVAFALSEIFVVSELGGNLDNQPYALGSYLDTLTRNAFGNYRQLLEDVTLHQAMGRYLDMLGNDKEDVATSRTPNENYAREVLQLFSIGLYQLNSDGTFKLDAASKPISTYDQDEVKGFAKVFTGWNWGGNTTRTDATWVNPAKQYLWEYAMQPWPSHHSTGEKLVLNGVTIPAGQTPEKDLKDALDNIFNHPNVGPFISRQLIQKLITSNPSPAYIMRVAAAFNDNGAGVRGDLKTVIRTILLDPEARGTSRAPYGTSRTGTQRGASSRQATNRGAPLVVPQQSTAPEVQNNAVTPPSAQVSSAKAVGKLREPIVRWAHLMRAFNPPTPDGRYRIWYIEAPEYGLGQSPLRSPSVFNFFEPDYSLPGVIAKSGVISPEFKLANETSVIGSVNFFRDTIYGGHAGWTGSPVTMDYSSYVDWAADPPKLVDQLNLIFMAGRMTDQTRTSIVTALNNMWAPDTGERLRMAIYLVTTSKEFIIQQ